MQLECLGMVRRCLNTDDEMMEPLIETGRCKTFKCSDVKGPRADG